MLIMVVNYSDILDKIAPPFSPSPCHQTVKERRLMDSHNVFTKIQNKRKLRNFLVHVETQQKLYLLQTFRRYLTQLNKFNQNQLIKKRTGRQSNIIQCSIYLSTYISIYLSSFIFDKCSLVYVYTLLSSFNSLKFEIPSF